MTTPDDSLSRLQDMAACVCETYVSRFGVDGSGLWLLAKMTEEMGEVSAAWLKQAGQSRGAAAPGDLADELADLMGFTLALAQSENIDLAAALDRKWGQHLPQGTKP
jgi:NTP pyrophosphatase (non-canonical NTP hydrolase)